MINNYTHLVHIVVCSKSNLLYVRFDIRFTYFPMILWHPYMLRNRTFFVDRNLTRPINQPIRKFHHQLFRQFSICPWYLQSFTIFNFQCKTMHFAAEKRLCWLTIRVGSLHLHSCGILKHICLHCWTKRSRKKKTCWWYLDPQSTFD